MNDAETLRRAVAEIREDYSGAETDSGEDDQFMFAVADLLTVIAWYPSTADPIDLAAALAVARAYLGGTP